MFYRQHKIKEIVKAKILLSLIYVLQLERVIIIEWINNIYILK